MRIVRPTIIALVAMTLLAACAGSPSRQPARQSDQQRFDRQAAGDIGAWPRTDLAQAWSTKFVPLEFFTIPPAALDRIAPFGRVAAVSTFRNLTTLRAPTAPTYGRVDFAGGGTLRVPLQPWSVAGRAFHSIHDVPACPTGTTSFDTACGLTATGIRLGTATLLTSRGPATVPAWLVTTTQLTEPIARVAIPNSAAIFETPRDALPSNCSPYAGGDPSAGPITCTASGDWCNPDLLGSISGKTVTYEVECGVSMIRPLVYETPTAVVIGATGVAPSSSAGTSNTLQSYETVVTVTLKAPLGTRPLLSIDNGYPVFMGEKFIKDSRN